jgi:hypothetical protein
MKFGFEHRIPCVFLVKGDLAGGNGRAAGQANCSAALFYVGALLITITK